MARKPVDKEALREQLARKVARETAYTMGIMVDTIQAAVDTRAAKRDRVYRGVQIIPHSKSCAFCGLARNQHSNGPIGQFPAHGACQRFRVSKPAEIKRITGRIIPGESRLDIGDYRNRGSKHRGKYRVRQSDRTSGILAFLESHATGIQKIQDLRVRLENLAFHGHNPQARDMARSLLGLPVEIRAPGKRKAVKARRMAGRITPATIPAVSTEIQDILSRWVAAQA